ncbi:hypothetical protein [Actinoplanes solisilvae]|uniref:hypothetical protein n=1 Tax=Actinoplanes solisilvae TaxID=2486853 RepID=UPI000FD80960|nr:hypothetical protein [Actinoplanes solisilvae]
MSNDLLGPGDVLLESLPDEVVATMEVRDRWLAGLKSADGGLEFLVVDLQAWVPGQRIRVAFRGGDPGLWADIEQATAPISAVANLHLDFRAGGEFRTWSEQDTEHAAEIRVAFDRKGYFSLVGTDSVNPRIGLPQEPVGGRPGQLSLNLGGFTVNRPATWAGTVRHEFLHALAFGHEHQNMRGPCEAAFRWEDDPGYQPTQDNRGGYVVDASGMRPGVYTYLSGFPNGWSRAKVDHNLRTPANTAALVAGPFDPASVMLYRFPALFYRSNPSPCAPVGPGQELSDGDRQGLTLLYPRDDVATDAARGRRENLARALESTPGDDGLESFPGPVAEFSREAAARLRACLGSAE